MPTDLLAPFKANKSAGCIPLVVASESGAVQTLAVLYQFGEVLTDGAGWYLKVHAVAVKVL